MPELVTDGPNIPVELLNTLDDDRVVFFCGAGISAAPGSDLPGFADLVREVYLRNRIEPDAAELAALGLDDAQFNTWRSKRERPERWQPLFDKALELLERQISLGATALRGTVIECLSELPTGKLSLHLALIDLSRVGKGVRLVTTNFDNRFVEAGLDQQLVDAAPKLPLPKPDDWSSLVHLHGRILPTDPHGSNLVLTAADFGRAYLTERWAARFVTELFREFTVVFVGYSVNDPVMGYMVDALAAERAKGGRFSRAYAFADHDGADGERQRVEGQWRAKNVEPILYDRRDGHASLAKTMIEWARIRRDPLRFRARIAVDEISNLPAGPGDPLAERVVWALEDPVAAEALADKPPMTDEDDFAKIEAWLEIFTVKGLLQCPVHTIRSPTGNPEPATTRLVDNNLHFGHPGDLDKTRKHLARWMAAHLHVPQLLAWVLRHGGYPHPHLREQIVARLAYNDHKINIPERLRILWSTLLTHRSSDHLIWIQILQHYNAATSDAERHRIEETVIEKISPHLIVQQGPKWSYPPASKPIEICGHMKLAMSNEYYLNLARRILTIPDALARHAQTLTSHLERALTLTDDADESRLRYLFLRPSIANHSQNSDRDVWNQLIDLVRDGYFALVAMKKKRAADNLLHRWIESDRPLFKRLALHAVTENLRSDIYLAERLLIGGRKPGLWDRKLQPEVLRFLREAGGRLPRKLRVSIVHEIHRGPRPGQRKKLNQANLHREKALRLYRLGISGAKLDKKSAALAREGVPDLRHPEIEREEFLVWSSEFRLISDGEFAPEELVQGSVADIIIALDTEKVSSDEFRGLLERAEVKVIDALLWLTTQERWPTRYWEGLLWYLSRPGEYERSVAQRNDRVACILCRAPDSLFAGVGESAAAFVKQIASDYNTEQEAKFGVIWTKVWMGQAHNISGKTHEESAPELALNNSAGRLAEAAWIRLQRKEPAIGDKIPESLRPYFDIIGMDSAEHIGRVRLMRWLQYLFEIDSDWTTKNLIARLDPRFSEEAADLWFAFGYSPRLTPNLWKAIRNAFLCFLEMGGLRRGISKKEVRQNLIEVFVAVCTSPAYEIAEDEQREVVGRLSEEALSMIIRSLARRLAGKRMQRAEVWRDTVFPWLRDYWPRAEGRNTAATSKMILAMLWKSGDAFPEAVEWSLGYLRPLAGIEADLIEFRVSGHAERHSEAVLKVLSRAVTTDGLPDFEKQSLRELLEAVEAARPCLRRDDRFVRLFRIASG